MNGGSLPDKRKQSCTPLQSKQTFDNKETVLLTLGTRLTSTPPEVHQGWIGDALPSTSITYAWIGTGEVFGKLLTQDAGMEEVGTVVDR